MSVLSVTVANPFGRTQVQALRTPINIDLHLAPTKTSKQGLTSIHHPTSTKNPHKKTSKTPSKPSSKKTDRKLIKNNKSQDSAFPVRLSPFSLHPSHPAMHPNQKKGGFRENSQRQAQSDVGYHSISSQKKKNKLHSFHAFIPIRLLSHSRKRSFSSFSSFGSAFRSFFGFSSSSFSHACFFAFSLFFASLRPRFLRFFFHTRMAYDFSNLMKLTTIGRVHTHFSYSFPLFRWTDECVAHDSFSYNFITLHFYMTMIVTIPRSLIFFFSLFDKPVSANGGWDGDTVLLFTLWGRKNRGRRKGEESF